MIQSERLTLREFQAADFEWRDTIAVAILSEEWVPLGPAPHLSTPVMDGP